MLANVAAGDGEAWALTDNGDVQGWGQRYCDASGCDAPADIPWLDQKSASIQVSTNGLFTAVLANNGTVKTWNGGTGDPSPSAWPLQSGEYATGISVGHDVLCIRFASGDARCESLGSSPSPAALASNSLTGTVADITAGEDHACAAFASGQVQCWGSNGYGQLGSSSASGVTTIALASTATRVTAGSDHTCAQLTTGAVQCWGRNDDGQLGHSGSGVGTVPLSGQAKSIATGAWHSCAVAGAGDLYCWGNDDFGQLGAGTNIGMLRHVGLGTSAAEAVFSGSSAWTTFVQLDHEGVRGWGQHDDGQTGYGDLVSPDPGPSWDVGTLPDIDIYDPDEED